MDLKNFYKKHSTVINIAGGLALAALIIWKRRAIWYYIKLPLRMANDALNAVELEKLHPKAKPIFATFIDRIKKLGYDVVITSSYRTFQEQAQLKKENASNAAPGRSYHNYGLACFSDDTEVLIENKGWVKFENVDVNNDNVLVFNKDSETTYFEKPNDYIAYPYSGKMIHIDTRSVDALITPNHKMIVKRKDNYKHVWPKEWTIIEASEINQYHKIPTIGKFENKYEIPEYPFKGRVSPEDWWEFMGWYLADGSSCGTSDNKRRKHNGRNIVRISKHKETTLEWEKINSLLTRMGFSYHYFGHDFRIDKKELWEVLFPIGRACQKYIPEYLFNAPRYLLSKLMVSMVDADGTFYKNRISYETTSPKLANDFSYLLCLLGYAHASVKREPRKGNFVKKINRMIIPKQPNYAIVTRENNTHELRDGNSKQRIFEKYYEGNVFCLSTNTGFLVVRRNGKVFITGNCDINVEKDGKFLKKASEIADWNKSGIPALAKSLGLNWGGDYQSYMDPIHFELRLKPIDDLYAAAIKQFGSVEKAEGNKVNV